MNIKTLICALSLMFCSCIYGTKPTQRPLTWEHNPNIAVHKAETSHKLVLLYFYGENCDWCETMNASLNDKSIRKLLNDKFVPVFINIETSKLAKASEITAVPTVVIVFPNEAGGEPVSSSVGFMDKDKLLMFLEQSIKKSNKFRVKLHL